MVEVSLKPVAAGNDGKSWRSRTKGRFWAPWTEGGKNLSSHCFQFVEVIVTDVIFSMTTGRQWKTRIQLSWAERTDCTVFYTNFLHFQHTWVWSLYKLWSFQGDRGERGRRGPRGSRGACGDKGESGDKGPIGEPVRILFLLILVFLLDCV